MGLVLKILSAVSYTGDRLYVYDNTQDYVDGDNHGWGQGDPVINRADRALVSFAKIINSDSTKELALTDQGVNQYFHVAPGAGLLNTDQSRFDYIVPKDGHYRYWIYPAVQAASAPAPSPDGIYYDTTEGKLKISDGSTWRDFDSGDLGVLEQNSATKMCEDIIIPRIVMLKNKFHRKAYTDTCECVEEYVNKERDVKRLIYLIGSTFAEGKQATARGFIDKTQDKYHEWL